MSGLHLLAKLRSRGIDVSVTERGTLRLESPEGTMSPRLCEWLRAKKPELIEALSLELRIRQMAERWEYDPAELAEALAGAATDPASWLAWIAWDETWTGGGAKPFRWHH